MLSNHHHAGLPDAGQMEEPSISLDFLYFLCVFKFVNFKPLYFLFILCTSVVKCIVLQVCLHKGCQLCGGGGGTIRTLSSSPIPPPQRP